MVGIKLLHLYRELSLSQRNELRSRCSNKNDKQFLILLQLLNFKCENSDELIPELKRLIDKQWPGSKDNEQKFRRLSLFVCEQFEIILIEHYLSENSAIKNSLIVRSIEQKGNLSLIKHYYEKLYKEASEKNHTGLKIQGLHGKIRMNYASQVESELKEALRANEELLTILNEDYQKRMVEYYYQCSNIYLEQNHLLVDKKENLNSSISNFLNSVNKPILRASLYLSLAKLNYDNKKLSEFLENANCELKNAVKQDREYEDIHRKIKFLELRLNFFSGKSLNYLLTLSEKVVDSFDKYSIINNNLLFYRLLFLILNSEFDKVDEFLNDKSLFFQGDSKIHRLFLQALYFERLGDLKKSTKILNEIMYSENYLVAVFSRLLFLKILTSKGKSSLYTSSVESTKRIINKNKNNQLGHVGHLYLVQFFKQKDQKKVEVFNDSEIQLNVLHRYILNNKID
jgi:hypothetical protein